MLPYNKSVPRFPHMAGRILRDLHALYPHTCTNFWRINTQGFRAKRAEYKLTARVAPEYVSGSVALSRTSLRAARAFIIPNATRSRRPVGRSGENAVVLEPIRPDTISFFFSFSVFDPHNNVDRV